MFWDGLCWAQVLSSGGYLALLFHEFSLKARKMGEREQKRKKRSILNANFDVNLWIVFSDVQAFKCRHWLLKFSTCITFLAFLVSFCLSYTQTTIYGLQGHHFCLFFFKISYHLKHAYNENYSSLFHIILFHSRVFL